MLKFGRNYQLYVQLQDGSTQMISLPFTIDFDISRDTLANCNYAHIRLYNLAPSTRNGIRFNINDSLGDSTLSGPSSDYLFRPVTLLAGYGDSLSTVFNGNITNAWSAREGVNYITTIDAFDGGYALQNAWYSVSSSATITQGGYIFSLLNSLKPGVKAGYIGPSFINDPITGAPILIPNGISQCGPSQDLLSKIAGKGKSGFFVDNGVANLLANNEYIPSPTVPVIDASTGLLGTPILEQTKITFDMVFEPRLSIGYQANLQGIDAPVVNGVQKFNGPNRVIGIKHHGMISPAVCGEVITTGEFYYNGQLTPALLVSEAEV